MTRRCPPGLRGPARARFLREQETYDRRLRDAGFRDVEGGADLNRIPATTLSGGQADGKRKPHHSLDGLNVELVDGEVGLGVGDDAAFWRAVGNIVSELPAGARWRRFLVAWSETGNLLAAARHHRLTERRARVVIKALLVANGLGDTPVARSVH